MLKLDILLLGLVGQRVTCQIWGIYRLYLLKLISLKIQFQFQKSCSFCLWEPESSQVFKAWSGGQLIDVFLNPEVILQSVEYWLRGCLNPSRIRRFFLYLVLIQSFFFDIAFRLPEISYCWYRLDIVLCNSEVSYYQYLKVLHSVSCR